MIKNWVNKNRILSPVQIIDLQLGIPQDYKQKCIDEIYRLGDSQNRSTNIKGTMTKGRIWEQSKIFNPLIKQIMLSIKDIYPLSDKRFNYGIDDIWGATYKNGDYTVAHTHGNSYLSFVYYLKSNGKTPIIFDECNFQMNPTDDLLIIFPSYIIHSVPPHEENEDRICIAGNISLDLKSKNLRQNLITKYNNPSDEHYE